jgi:hypothetical protein
MYFDLDHQVELSAGADDPLARAAEEIRKRRGRIVAASPEILVFSAPFWRANGPLYFFVRQLPLGVSHGVLQVLARDTAVTVVRCRVSLLWLRVCVAALALLLVSAALRPSASERAILWLVLLIGLFAGAAIYAFALVEARRFFEQIILGIREGLNRDRS